MSKGGKRMKKEVVRKVDKTIKSLCEDIRREDISSEEKEGLVKALASLIEARAKINLFTS